MSLVEHKKVVELNKNKEILYRKRETSEIPVTLRKSVQQQFNSSIVQQFGRVKVKILRSLVKFVVFFSLSGFLLGTNVKRKKRQTTFLAVHWIYIFL